jgi:hypothetical protein
LLSRLQLEQWNRAYLYEAQQVPAALLQGSALYDGGSAGSTDPIFPLVGYDVKAQCKGPGSAVDPTQVKPGTCQYRANKDGTFTYWEKQPGDWARMSNCYCYALNIFKAAWCQPGAATGVNIDQNSMSCASLKKALVADGAKEVTAAQALNTKAPTGHYIAMMFRPQSSCNFARCQPDFHFMRKDSNGMWSHKAGEAPAANKDANGALIKDPKTAKISGQYTGVCVCMCACVRALTSHRCAVASVHATPARRAVVVGLVHGHHGAMHSQVFGMLKRRGLPGPRHQPYKVLAYLDATATVACSGQPVTCWPCAAAVVHCVEFCGYFHVEPAKMKVGTIPVPNLVSRGVEKWKSSGLKVSVQPLAYNAAVDAVDAAADYSAVQQRQFAVQRGETPAGGNRKLLALSGGL